MKSREELLELVKKTLSENDGDGMKAIEALNRLAANDGELFFGLALMA